MFTGDIILVQGIGKRQKTIRKFRKHICDNCSSVFNLSPKLHSINERTCNGFSFCNRNCLNEYRSQGGEHSANWKGFVKHADGYIWKTVPADTHGAVDYGDENRISKRILEHRYVWQKEIGDKIGYLLQKTDTIHHKNGIRDDNRPENLELRNGAHGCGTTIFSDPINKLVVENIKLRKQLLKFEPALDQNSLIGDSI